MSIPFQEGETYRNVVTNQHIMVLAIVDDHKEYEVLLAYLEVDPEDYSTKYAGELLVPSERFDEWIRVEV